VLVVSFLLMLSVTTLWVLKLWSRNPVRLLTMSVSLVSIAENDPARVSRQAKVFSRTPDHCDT